jgi:hypothetical protein
MPTITTGDRHAGDVRRAADSHLTATVHRVSIGLILRLTTIGLHAHAPRRAG